MQLASDSARPHPLAFARGVFALALLLFAQVATFAADRPDSDLGHGGALDACCCEVVPTPASIVEANADGCCASEASETEHGSERVVPSEGCGCHAAPALPDGDQPRAQCMPLARGLERETYGDDAARATLVIADRAALWQARLCASTFGRVALERGRRRATSPPRTAAMGGAPSHLAVLSVARR